MVKDFFQDGKWIEKPKATTVLVCECGNKYIKTRARQKTCLICISESLRR